MGDLVNLSERWNRRLNDKGALGPLWLGLFIACAYLLARCLFDGFFLAVWGFPGGTYPLWQSRDEWSEVINAILLGYIPAAMLVARQGIDRDLSALRSQLLVDDTGVENIRSAASGPAKPVAQLFRLTGIVAGFLLVIVDPSLSQGTERSLTNPVFVWPLVQTPVFTWLVFTLIASDLRATHTYFDMGKNLINLDLLDVQSQSPFAHRGLRSALTWVIFSMIFSIFWIGDFASSANLLLVITALTMATGAFVTPLLGVHYNIVSAKRLELDRLLGEIRIERDAGYHTSPSDEGASPQLANLIAYYQLIEGTREWPIDAANVLRFSMYILLGLGSWLGGAMVERLLDSTLG